MPLPANTTTVVVLGTFNTPEGNPSTGTITFTPSAWLLNSGANIAIPNSGVTKTLGTAGNFSVTLPITDDADLSPTGWVYGVSEVIDGVSQSYNIAIPGTVASGGTVFLADLTPVAPAGPEYYSLASSLAIGTVTKIAPGGDPTATITGLAPSQTLNLGLVTGDTGSVSTLGTGSAGTAAISPTGDTDTGFFFPAANTVAVTTGGTERVRVNSSGNVGIGTSSPIGQIDIYHATTASSSLRGDGTTYLNMRRSSTDASGSIIYIDKTRGSNASPSVVAASDVIGQLVFRGYDGSQYRNAVILQALVDGTPGASDMPGHFSVLTTPDNTTSPTERMRIDSNGLITGTGTSLGAWTAYTPTLGGTGWAIGDGTATGAYCRIGKLVVFRAKIVFGSTSTYGAGSFDLTLPVTASSGAEAIIGRGRFTDTGTATYGTDLIIQSTTQVTCRINGTNGLWGVPSSSSPFTWASTDIIAINGVYEAA